MSSSIPTILVLNAGSSSIKFALYLLSGMTAVLRGQIDGLCTDNTHFKASDSTGKRITDTALPAVNTHTSALHHLLDWFDAQNHDYRIVAVGHRVVHGGIHFSQPVKVDEQVLETLHALFPLAPLHAPHNTAGIESISALLPNMMQVACFDTAFHRTQPEVAQRIALPREISAQGVRRYGFHGLSYEYIAGILPDHLGERADAKVIVAHLGNGGSMCAMINRKSIATTMGFTTLDGLVMGTRTGNIDPGVLLYLMQVQGMGVDQLSQLLYRESGLLGISGISADMRTLLTSDAPEAEEALESFCYRIQREIGSLAAALQGLDALVFTGGIGENAPSIRERVCAGLGWLGVGTDKVSVLTLPTDEELVIARHTAKFIEQASR